MDPLSISAVVAGLLSLALENPRILKAYIGDAKSASEEARNLLMEVSSLCHVLDQLVRLLRKDIKDNFEPTSAMVVAINACQQQIHGLYQKIAKLEVHEKGITRIIERMKWPLRIDDYQTTVSMLQRFLQMFRFSLTVANWLVHFDLCTR
ncbi:hypothetical protein FPQ18DRAFT_123346 [Pyronema domesticum]|nr:hypothetical protein FPQ18DRAFT_123346 [Pyronema domesticum]